MGHDFNRPRNTDAPEHPLSPGCYLAQAPMLIAQSQSASGGRVTLLRCVDMNFPDTKTGQILMAADYDGVSGLRTQGGLYDLYLLRLL